MAAVARVLILNERDAAHPKAGGAEVHVGEIFGRLAERGMEVVQLACRFPGADAEEPRDGIHVVRLAPLPAYYLRAAQRCARETRRGRHDVVVDCLNKLPFLSPLYSAAPVLAVCHHLFGETAFHQVAFPLAAAVWGVEQLIPRVYRHTPFVSISESTRDDLVARGIPAEHVGVVHCGIRRPSGAPPDPRGRPERVVFVGRLEPYKRVDLLLRALARLAPRFPKAELVVIGRGREQPRLEALAAELGLASRTHFAGFVPDAERDRLVAGARVGVCPSRKEGWGLTVIEANALGTPVVATDAPGLRDSVEDGATGFLVPDGDVEALADRIGRLLGDEDLRAGMSAAALAWSRRFDWDRAADAMADALAACRDAAHRPE